MESLSKSAKNSVILTLAEAINKIIALFLVIILARYLGEAGFGQYSFVITMMVLFQVLAEFGIDGLIIREMSKHKNKTSHYLGNVLIIKALLGIITFVLLWVSMMLLNKPPAVFWSVMLIGMALIFSSFSSAFFSVFNAHERLEYKALIIVASKLIVLFLTVLIINSKGNLIQIISAILGAEIIKTFLGARFYFKKFSGLKLKFEPKLCINLIKTSIPFAIIGIIALVYFKIDIIMLSVMKNDQMVGWYSAAYGLLAAFLFITEAYMLSVFPALSRSAVDAKKMLGFIWERSVKYLLVLSLFIAFLVGSLAQKLIVGIFSDSYLQSVKALQILIWTLPWIFVNAINMRVLYASNKQMQATVIVFFSMLLNVGLNFLLIPKYGFIGAAWATVTAEGVNVLLFFLLIRKLLHLRLPPKNILRPLLAFCITAFLWTKIGTVHILPMILLALIVYPVCLLLLKVFDDEDRRIFSKIVSF